MQQTKSRLKILKTCLQLQMQRHQAINSINVYLKNVFDFEKNRICEVSVPLYSGLCKLNERIMLTFFFYFEIQEQEVSSNI